MRQLKPNAHVIAEVIDLKKRGANKAQIRDRINVSETNIDAIWKKHLADHPEDRKAKTGNPGIK